MSEKEKEIRLNVRMDEDIKKKVKAKAALAGKSLSDITRELMEQWLQEIEDENT